MLVSDKENEEFLAMFIRKEYGHKPLDEFVREIVGLDMNVAKEVFSEFLNDTNTANIMK